MRNKLILLFLFSYCSLRLLAGDGDYAVSKIPAALLKDARVIKRMDDIRFEITENNHARLYRKVAYTILNEQGERWAFFSEGYDKLRSIESFEGSLFDEAGKKNKEPEKIRHQGCQRQ